ncbi:hypothetical protein BDQ12DRAFT_726288 [Crucibulum laeve]|uniref:Uncharacterized protein n=1 Tax=Crucibulum laeve TaxID=68775 RepID=A0A5C3LQS4_9AGAR|nr:hypothetical protein BDQ12DRAFT_726288 [Crucibulum laeve]
MPFFQNAKDVNIHGSPMNDVAGDQYNGQSSHHQGNINHGDYFHGRVNNSGVLGVRGDNARPTVNNHGTHLFTHYSYDIIISFFGTEGRQRAPTLEESDSDNEDENPQMIHMQRMLDEARRERDEARAKCADLEKQLQQALSPKKAAKFGRT